MLLYDQDKQYREEIKKAKLPVTRLGAENHEKVVLSLRFLSL